MIVVAISFYHSCICECCASSGPMSEHMIGGPLLPGVTLESVFFCVHVLPFLLHHGPEPWTRKGHWVFGGCGQSCGCCRSHNPEDAAPDANCVVCYQGWVVTTVSRGWKEQAQACARQYSRRNVLSKGWILCRCGMCADEWLARGWNCPHRIYYP